MSKNKNPEEKIPKLSESVGTTDQKDIPPIIGSTDLSGSEKTQENSEAAGVSNPTKPIDNTTPAGENGNDAVGLIRVIYKGGVNLRMNPSFKSPIYGTSRYGEVFQSNGKCDGDTGDFWTLQNGLFVSADPQHTELVQP